MLTFDLSWRLMPISMAKSSLFRLIREKVMRNHCASCHGKFGLVRHRRASKSFCSQKCVDQHKAWLRAAQGANRQSWFDCLWATSLNVIPYAGARTRQLNGTLFLTSEKCVRETRL